MEALMSYQLFKNKGNADGGYPVIDPVTHTINAIYIPVSSQETYKGSYANEAAIILSNPAGVLNDSAYNQATKSFWFWNSGLVVPTWVNQETTDLLYTALIANAKAVCKSSLSKKSLVNSRLIFLLIINLIGFFVCFKIN